MATSKKLQIPINSKLDKELKKQSDYWGFSSTNDFARFILHNYCAGNISINFPHPCLRNRDIPMVDSETEAGIAQSLRDYANGDYDIVDPSKPGALEAYVDKISKQTGSKKVYK